ncbi:hypothetical protein [Paracoccus lutimaris]|uniref:Uncharacterized protein n=1 Tax=Paracoccus lutimaris TaxID=1490030 RepID=A0A368YPD4_9RHOB|nr:hypothetical protein [Paracoccus lutimaris]RCW82073.1 hypothetical protein DFP89_11332 [Paracoccus lutimaris]
MTPRKVLLLGNSYSAAPRVALRNDPGRWPGLQVTVLAMPGNMLAALALEEGRLVPRGDDARYSMGYYNDMTELALAGFDAFAVIGGLSFYTLLPLQNTHRSPDFPSVMRGEACQLISTGLMDAMIRQHMTISAALCTIRLLAGLGQGPVLFMDSLFPSADCWQDGERFDPYIAMAERGDAAAFHARYLRILHEALGSDATYLPQPVQTIVEEVFTAPEWIRGSLRMQPRRDVPHEKTDFGHANPAYGALQVDLIASALAGL